MFILLGIQRGLSNYKIWRYNFDKLSTIDNRLIASIFENIFERLYNILSNKFQHF